MQILSGDAFLAIQLNFGEGGRLCDKLVIDGDFIPDLIIAVKIFTGLLDVGPNLVFLHPTRNGIRSYSKVRAIAGGEGREILE